MPEGGDEKFLIKITNNILGTTVYVRAFCTIQYSSVRKSRFPFSSSAAAALALPCNQETVPPPPPPISVVPLQTCPCAMYSISSSPLSFDRYSEGPQKLTRERVRKKKEILIMYLYYK